MKQLLPLFLLVAIALPAQVTLRVSSLPASTPIGATIYVAGSFNTQFEYTELGRYGRRESGYSSHECTDFEFCISDTATQPDAQDLDLPSTGLSDQYQALSVVVYARWAKSVR